MARRSPANLCLGIWVTVTAIAAAAQAQNAPPARSAGDGRRDPFADYTTFWAEAGARGSGQSSTDPGDLATLMARLATPAPGAPGQRILLLDTGGPYEVSGGGFKDPPLQFKADGRDADARLGLQNAPGHRPVINCSGGQGILGTNGGAYHYWRGLALTSSAGAQCSSAIVLVDGCREQLVEHIEIRNVVGGAGVGSNTGGIMIRNCSSVQVRYTDIDGVRDAAGGTHLNTAAIHVYSTPDLAISYSRFRNTRSGVFLKERELGATRGLPGFLRAVAEYNVFETEYAFQFGTSYESAGRRLRYNVINTRYGLFNSIIALPQGDDNAAFDDVQFYGNTIVVSDAAHDGAAWFPEVSNGNVGWSGAGNGFYNNIVFLPNDLGDYFRVQNHGKVGSGKVSAGFELDYNLYYRAKGADVWRQNGTTYGSLGRWRAATGHEAHSIVADPLFVDAEKNDFRLRAGSPALHAALNNDEGGDGQLGAFGGPGGQFLEKLLTSVGPAGASTEVGTPRAR